jgi:hypothetical protein
MLGDFLTGQAGRIAEPAQLQREPAAPDGGALLGGRGDLLPSGKRLPSVWHLSPRPVPLSLSRATFPAG